MNRILLAGGGTLGSVSPLIAIRQAYPEADYLFISTGSGLDDKFVRQFNLRTIGIPAGKLRRYFSLFNLIDFFKSVGGFFISLVIIQRYKPDIVLTSGSYVAVPVAWAAKILGKKIVLHQQDAKIGLANRMIAPIANVITVAFKDLLEIFPDKNVFYTGNPVRNIGLPNGTNPKEKSLLILGGSQGARGLNELVNQFIPQWSKQYNVIHVLGDGNYDQRLDLKNNYQPLRFIMDDFGTMLSKASLVITRAGMSTLTELAYFSKPTIIIPMPHSHQEYNADLLSRHSAARIIHQQEPQSLAVAVIDLMSDAPAAKEMGIKMHQLFNSNATLNYIELIKREIEVRVDIRPKVYLSGIGGIGVSALARYFLHQGYQVYGSDLAASDITRALQLVGVTFYGNQTKNNLPADLSLFIYSAAIPNSNEELQEAKRRHVPTYSYNDYLGIISREKNTLAIAGTHGKTTTTAMAGTIAITAGLDPTIIVGGLIPQFNNGNYQAGNSDLFIVEACEYRGHMLKLQPKTIILTNIEEDHLDYYRDIDDICSKFQTFVDHLPADGLLIINRDDIYSQRIKSKVRTISYGLTQPADLIASNIEVQDDQQHFSVNFQGKNLGRFVLPVPGLFNIYNALAAMAVTLELNVEVTTIRESLKDFRGSWRRFEKIGKLADNPIYSDYAHHPTAIAATIEAAKKFYPKRKLLAIFQPHTSSRTEALMADFSQAFDLADEAIITSTYQVSGREDGNKAVDSAKILSQKIGRPKIKYVENFEQLTEQLNLLPQQDYLIIFMGAGSIDSFARDYVRKHSATK